MTPEPMSAETKWPRFEALPDSNGWFVRVHFQRLHHAWEADVADGLTEPQARAMAKALNLAGPALALAEAHEHIAARDRNAQPVPLAALKTRGLAFAAFRAAREAQEKRDAE